GGAHRPPDGRRPQRAQPDRRGRSQRRRQQPLLATGSSRSGFPPMLGPGGTLEPSVKGTIVLGVVAALRKLRKQGGRLQAQGAAGLSGGALELLEQKIEFSRWYPMPVFRELVEFEWDEIAKHDPEHARQAGVLSAERQFASGRYQQLDFARRAQ